MLFGCRKFPCWMMDISKMDFVSECLQGLFCFMGLGCQKVLP